MRSLSVAVLLVSCAGNPPPETLADACYGLAVTLCDRHQSCGTLTGSIGECRTAGVNACCAGADCAAPIRECKSGKTCCTDAKCTATALDLGHVEAVFGACDSATRALSCGQLAAGLQPSACASGAADAGR